MKVNKAVTKVMTIGSEAGSIGHLDAKEEQAKVKSDSGKKSSQWSDSIFGVPTEIPASIRFAKSNTFKKHVNTAKFSKKAKLKRRKAR